MGDVINSPYDEDGIFIHPSGKILYFSSQGHESIGGYDIFYSSMDDSGNWSYPVNLGYPINSTDDDVFFVTSADGRRGYFSSFKENGIGEKDIYKIALEDNVAAPLTLLLGTVRIRNRDFLPDDALISVTNKETGEIVGNYTPRKRDGKFSLILMPRSTYLIEYSAGGFKKTEEFYLEPTSSYQEISRAIVLDDVIFDENKIIDNNKNTNTTVSDGDGSQELYNEIKSLKTQVSTLKNQLAKNENTSVSSTDTPSSNNKEAELMKELAKLKDEINRLKSTKNITTASPTPIVINNVSAYYQEFFNYNNKEINTSASKYISMLDKAIEQSKKGKIIIDIESSASKVPTRTYRTNKNLASERAKSAQQTVIQSLIKRGVDKSNIIINEIDASVKGPKYNDDYKNTSLYEQYQYIVIKIK